MNLMASGLMLVAMGVIGFMVVLKEYMTKGYINPKEVTLSKVLLVLTLVGIILMAIGWSGLMNIVA